MFVLTAIFLDTLEKSEWRFLQKPHETLEAIFKKTTEIIVKNLNFNITVGDGEYSSYISLKIAILIGQELSVIKRLKPNEIMSQILSGLTQEAVDNICRTLAGTIQRPFKFSVLKGIIPHSMSGQTEVYFNDLNIKTLSFVVDYICPEVDPFESATEDTLKGSAIERQQKFLLNFLHELTHYGTLEQCIKLVQPERTINQDYFKKLAEQSFYIFSRFNFSDSCKQYLNFITELTFRLEFLGMLMTLMKKELSKDLLLLITHQFKDSDISQMYSVCSFFNNSKLQMKAMLETNAREQIIEWNSNSHS